MTIKFNCSKCGSDRLEEIRVGVVQSTEILGVDENDLILVGNTTTIGSGGQTDCFQCASCGDVLKNAAGDKIDTLNKAVDWLKEQAGERNK